MTLQRLTGGAKRQADPSPLPLPARFPRSGPERMIKWVERFIVVPTGHGRGKPMKLAAFQKRIIREVFRDQAVRSALVSLPRGNGKTSLSAALALFHLLDVRDDEPEVLAVASDERTAEVLLDMCRRMVALHPELAARVVPYRDRLTVPGNAGVMWALPSTESALHGRNPTYLSLDELHLCSEPIWSACTTAAGKRPRSMVLAISTPAANRHESVMWSLCQHGRTGEDPTFRLIEFSAPEGCEAGDEKAWRIANPAIAAGFLDPAGIRSNLRTMPEWRFRQLRLGQWADHDSGWIGYSEWMALADPDRVIEPGTRITLGWDGSVRNDASVLMACTVPSSPDDVAHIWPVGIWARDRTDPNWQVPRHEVDAVIRETFRTFDVEALVADPAFWQAELQRWHAEFGDGRVIEFPTQSAQRMARATDRLYAAIKDRTVSHDGDELVAQHVANAVVRLTPQGDVPVKRTKNDQRKIDALIAAILAHSWADQVANAPEPQPSLAGVIFI